MNLEHYLKRKAKDNLTVFLLLTQFIGDFSFIWFGEKPFDTMIFGV